MQTQTQKNVTIALLSEEKGKTMNEINPTLTMGNDLPHPGMNASRMFYFNIAGSTNQKDVKLVAFLSNSVEFGGTDQCCAYFDNDVTQSWQSMKYHRLKWELPTKYDLFCMASDFWVSNLLLLLFFGVALGFLWVFF